MYWQAIYTRTIAWDKINNFRATYFRINAIYHLIYNSKQTPLEIEKLLIEMLVQKTIQKDFEKNQYHTCLMPRFDAVFSCTEQEEHITIKLNPRMLQLGKGILAGEIKLLEQEVKEVTIERDKAIEQLAETKKELLDKESALQVTTEELEATKEKLGAKEKELGVIEKELGATTLALASKTKESEEAKLALALKTNELIKIKDVADAKEKEHQALMARLLQTKGLTLFSNTNESQRDGEFEENTVSFN